MNRALTEQERNWLVRGLNALGTGEYFGGGRWIDTKTNKRKRLDDPVDPTSLLNEVDDLRVIDECDCGEPNCHTVKFQNFERGKSAAIVCYYTEDSRMLIVHVKKTMVGSRN